jgi:NTE family protein
MIKSRRLQRTINLLALFCVTGMMFTIFLNVTRAEPAQSFRPTIGLALGGGSAMGFTHIGVLKWLEENRIPVDYISGTSIGGLVGCCYAMGWAPDKIESFVTDKEINWAEMFNLVPDYEVLDFRRKEDRRDYPVEMEIGLIGRDIKLPGGLTAAHQVGLILSRITLPYSTINDYNELPIPFRCVATDIRNAKVITKRNGPLNEALRATMAIPGFFTPVELDGRLLVDGGVLDNVPVDVIQEMGADIKVAVNLVPENQAQKRYGIDSVLMRTIDTVFADNTSRALNLADLVITPKMGDLSITSWDKVKKLIQLGYDTAVEQAAGLKKYALDEPAWRDYLQARSQRQKTGFTVPADIEVTGTNPVNQAFIKKSLKAYIGKPLDTKALEADLTEITGSGLYESLRYRYILKAGEPVLLIQAVEKPYGPPLINFALILDADGIRGDHVDINARARITSFNVTGLRSELRTDLGLGTELHLLTELYQPLGDSKWFVAPAAFLDQNNSSLYEDELRVSDYKATEWGVRLDFGYAVNKFAEVRAGYTAELQRAWTRVGEPLAADLEGEIRMAELQWTYSNADGAILFRKGFNWNFDAGWYFQAPGATDQFGLAEIKSVWSYPVGSNDSFFMRFSGGTSIGGDPPLLQQFRLGGPFKLGTFNFDELRGNNYLLGNIGYLKSIGKFPLTGKNLYLGVWLEHGGVFDSWSEIRLDSDVSAGLLSPTVFGPVYIGASYGKGANPFFNIMIGRIF